MKEVCGVVDRIESGDKIVVELENGHTKDFSAHLFSFPVKPGDAVYMKNGKFEHDNEKTDALKKEIKNLMDDLFVDE